MVAVHSERRFSALRPLLWRVDAVATHVRHSGATFRRDTATVDAPKPTTRRVDRLAVLEPVEQLAERRRIIAQDHAVHGATRQGGRR